MESDDAQSFKISLGSNKKLVTAMHSRLLQLRQQQLGQLQVQQKLMRDFKSCLARPCLLRKGQVRSCISPAPGEKHSSARASASCVRTTRTSARGKRRPVRHKRQLETLPPSKSVLPQGISKHHVPRRHCSRCSQPGNQTVSGTDGLNVSPKKGCLPCLLCGTYYSVLGVMPDATSQEIRKAFLRLAARWHPDKGGRGTAFLQCQEAYDVLKHPESRKAYDIQVACRALIPLLETEEDLDRAGTRGDRSQPARNTSQPLHEVNPSAVDTGCAPPPTVASFGSTEKEDDHRWYFDFSCSKGPLFSSADNRKMDKRSPGRDPSHCQFSCDRVSRTETGELSLLREVEGELCWPVSPLSSRATSRDESSVLTLGRLYSGSIDYLPTSPTTYCKQTNPKWVEVYFGILRELFFKPILPDYMAQNFPRLQCAQELFLRLQHLLERLRRLRYHRSVFVQPFAIGPRCARSLAGSSVGNQLTVLRSGNPKRRTSCSPSHKRILAGNVTASDWRKLPRQTERIGVRSLRGKGESCVSQRCLDERNSAHSWSSAAQDQTEHLQARANHVDIEATPKGSGLGTDRNKERVTGRTWWVAALREELTLESSGKGDEYRYVQLLPPPTRDDKDSWILSLMRTISFTTRNTAASNITTDGQRSPHRFVREKMFGDQAWPTNAKLTDVPKESPKQCSVGEQFLPVWGIVFIKNRQVVDDIRSTVRSVLSLQKSQASPIPGTSSSESWQVPPKRHTASPAVQSSSATGQCDAELASPAEAQKALCFETASIAKVSSAIHSDQVSRRSTPSATLDHLMRCLLGRFALRDCLVLLATPLEQFTGKRLQSSNCNAICRPATLSQRRDSQNAFSSLSHTRLGSAYAPNGGTCLSSTFSQAFSADRRLSTTTGEGLHFVRSGRPTPSVNRTSWDSGCPAASTGTSVTDVCLPVWVVTKLHSQQRSGEEYTAQSPLEAPSANSRHFMLLQPQEPTLRWLGHALIELCGHAAAEL